MRKARLEVTMSRREKEDLVRMAAEHERTAAQEVRLAVREKVIMWNYARQGRS
jgi:hypothetical protein